MKPFEHFELPTGHLPTFNKDGTFSGPSGSPRQLGIPTLRWPDMTSVCLLPRGESDEYRNNSRWSTLLFEEKDTLLGVLETTSPKITVPMNEGVTSATFCIENLTHLMRFASGEPISCFASDIETTARRALGTEEIEIVTSKFLKNNEVFAVDIEKFKGVIPQRNEHWLWGAIIFDTSRIVCLTSSRKVSRLRWKILRSYRGVV